MVSKRNKSVPMFRPGEQHRRAGLTLTELLVVIAILVVVTSVLAPLIAPSLEGREVREAARQVNAYFQQAQAKAKQLGRPVGVVIQRSPNDPVTDASGNIVQDFAYQLSLAEQPPSFRGFTALDTATLDVAANGRLTTTTALGQDAGVAGIVVPGTGTPDIGFFKMVQPNDRIRFNFRGPKYRIVSVTETGETAPNPMFDITFLTEPSDPTSYVRGNSVKFEVFRRPRTSSSTPLELPTGTAIVMDLSGVGLDYLSSAMAGIGSSGVEAQMAGFSPRQKYIGLREFRRLNKAEFPASLDQAVFDELAKLPLTIMFAPDGSIDYVYRVLPPYNVVSQASLNMALLPPKKPQDKIYLFIGKDAADTTTNFADTTNIWVTVDPQNGLVSTAPHVPDTTIDPATNPLAAIAAARQIAATGQSMGGQ